MPKRKAQAVAMPNKASIRQICRSAMALLCAALMFTLSMPALAELTTDLKPTAQSAVLLERSTRMVLYGSNAHKKLPMASTTKIMTALIAIENGRLDDIVTVPKEAYGVEGSSMYLMLGEKVSLLDLLYGLMVNSGNDAAIAIAIHIGGNVEGFTELMNKRAEKLGLTNTHFVTPNGLHDKEHYTTAYDLAVIACEAMNNEIFRQLASTSYYTTQTGEVKRYLKSKNKLLWQYEGSTGIKTGYTKAAGKCLVFSAERDGMETVGVVLNSADIFDDASKILDYGFSSYKMSVLVSKGEVVAIAEVTNGRKRLLELAAKEDIMSPVSVSDGMRLRPRAVYEKELQAPIEQGLTLGRLELYDGERLVAVVPLVAAENIAGLTLKDFIKTVVGLW